MNQTLLISKALALAEQPKLKQLLLTLGALVWLLAAGACYAAMLSYERIDGAASAAPALWPRKSSVLRHPGRFSLLMFVHPKCPCSRASISQLAKLLARQNADLDTTIVVLKPTGESENWEKTDIYQQAVGIPGAIVLSDLGGIESKVFGASTSGVTLLYDSSGRLAFSGGITAGRGQGGYNLGQSSIEYFLSHARPEVVADRAAPSSTPVYGCSLSDDRCPNREVLNKCLR